MFTIYPEDAPTEFIPPSLSQFIKDSENNIDRHAWETVLLKAVRDEIKNGNLSVKKSRFFQQFNQFFMSDTHWKQVRKGFLLKQDYLATQKTLQTI